MQTTIGRRKCAFCYSVLSPVIPALTACETKRRLAAEQSRRRLYGVQVSLPRRLPGVALTAMPPKIRLKHSPAVYLAVSATHHTAERIIRGVTLGNAGQRREAPVSDEVQSR